MRVVPPVKAIVYFDAVARILSFKLAAEELCVTPGAVSHQINLLEDFIGQKLFLRKTRGLQLTNAGLRYFTRTTYILNELEQASADLGKQTQTEIIKIAVPPALLNYWLIPRLQMNEYSQKGISFEFLESLSFERKRLKNELDIAIYYGLKAPDNLYTQHLFDENMIVVCSPELLQFYPVKEIETYLLSTPLIYTTNRLIQWDLILHQYKIESSDISQKVVFQNSIQAITAALHSAGLALVNKMLVKPLLDNKQLIEPFKLNPRTQKVPAYFLTCSMDNIEKPLVKYCVDEIVALAKECNVDFSRK